MQSAKCRNCVAIIMPPSDEGGGFCVAKDGGRDRFIVYLISPSVSLCSTAPSSEGAEKQQVGAIHESPDLVYIGTFRTGHS